MSLVQSELAVLSELPVLAVRHPEKRRAPFARLFAASVLTAALVAASLTVSPVAPASAAELTPVATGDEFIAALNAGESIQLTGSDPIVMTNTGIAVPVGGDVTLDLNGRAVTVTGALKKAGIGVPFGASLTITDSSVAQTGELTANGGTQAAGIGGSFEEAGGALTVTAGSITARGGNSAAGIGGGFRGAGGTVTVSGGTVTASSDFDGAGIGGGISGAGGSVTVSGGIVNATGGRGGAGIGGGPGGAGGAVTVASGIVNATAGTNAAGIGGGRSGAGAVVDLASAAVVTAVGNPASGSFTIGAGAVTGNFGSLRNAGSLTIPLDSQLRIPSGVTVANSGAIAILGSIHNAGVLENTGTITNDGSIINTGEINPADSVRGRNYVVTFTEPHPDAPAGAVTQRVYARTLADAQIALPAPEWMGHDFVGWFAAAGGAWQDTTPITANVILHARWEVASHTVTFDGNGSDYAGSVDAAHGTPVAPPAPPFRAKHIFLGWFDAPAGGRLWDFQTATVTADTTLYAQWRSTTHRVEFDSDGGSDVAEVSAEYGTTLLAPTAPTKLGHAFVGWFTAPWWGTEWDFNTRLVDGDIILYAQWAVNRHTVAFDARGGGSVAGQTVDYGKKVLAPTVPKRTGYTFAGWFTAASGGAKWNFGTAVVKTDTVLFAQWVKVVTTGTVTGVVKSSAGAVLAGVAVTAYNTKTGAAAGTATTDAAGRYTLKNLPAGSYTVRFAKSGYLTEWWSNAATAAAAKPFTVAARATVSVNAAIAKSAKVSGVLKNAAGAVLAGVTVTVSGTKAGMRGGTVKTDATGRYTVPNVAAGSYTMKFARAGYVTEWWSNASTAASAKPFAVTEGAAVAKSAVMARLTVKAATPRISGTVAVGRTVKAVTGTWTSGTAFTYQWLAEGKAIRGATKSSFVITTAQKGLALSVKVTGTKASHVSASKTSAKTAKVAR